jgi:hypothetical protein
MIIKLLETEKIQGDLTGALLFLVTTIDTDDAEDTTSEFWQANDEDQLYNLVKQSYVGEDFMEEDDFMSEQLIDKFDEDWGINILYKHIANIEIQ